MYYLCEKDPAMEVCRVRKYLAADRIGCDHHHIRLPRRYPPQLIIIYFWMWFSSICKGYWVRVNDPLQNVLSLLTIQSSEWMHSRGESQKIILRPTRTKHLYHHPDNISNKMVITVITVWIILIYIVFVVQLKKIRRHLIWSNLIGLPIDFIPGLFPLTLERTTTSVSKYFSILVKNKMFILVVTQFSFGSFVDVIGWLSAHLCWPFAQDNGYCNSISTNLKPSLLW